MKLDIEAQFKVFICIASFKNSVIRHACNLFSIISGCLIIVYAIFKFFELYIIFEQAIVKPQCIEIIRNELKGNIQQIVDQNDERDVKEELCSHLQLNEIMDRNLEDLSSGEIQRLAIALAAMRNAEIYMFDEPSSYLDVKQRYKAAQVIRSLLRPNRFVKFLYLLINVSIFCI